MKNKPDLYSRGSKLRVEWTNQHACGNDPTTFCTMILQYTCETRRSCFRRVPLGRSSRCRREQRGLLTEIHESFVQRNNGDGTTTIPTDAQSASDTEYGMHESFDYYTKCSNVERNHGLYIADRNLGCDASGDSNRTERDMGMNVTRREIITHIGIHHLGEIAVLTTDPAWCSYYRENSEM